MLGAFGAVAAKVLPQHMRRLASGNLPAHLNLINRAMIVALQRRHERKGTSLPIGAFHAWMWSGEQAVRFHALGESRSMRWWVESHARIVDQMAACIEAAPGRYSTLCEIGCGSGVVLQDLHARLKTISVFIGLDLNRAQTQRNRERYPGSALQFETGDATQWVPEHSQPGWIYFTNAGVLEYLEQGSVEFLLAHISRSKAPAMFAMIEPLPRDFDLAAERQSRPYGLERSFGHNYPRMFADAGWWIGFQEETILDGTRFLLLVAETPRR